MQTEDILSDLPAYSSEDTDQTNIPIMAIEIVQEMALLFAGDLNPVAPKAQRKVQIPDGLNLDEWINPPPAVDSSSGSEDEQPELFGSGTAYDERRERQRATVEPSKEELLKVIILLSILYYIFKKI